jgi:hypothetical protein
MWAAGLVQSLFPLEIFFNFTKNKGGTKMADYKDKQENQGQQQTAGRESQGGQKDQQQGAPGRNPEGGMSVGGQQGGDKGDKQGGQDRQGGQSTGEPGEREETRR